jgi:hypothetical protein
VYAQGVHPTPRRRPDRTANSKENYDVRNTNNKENVKEARKKYGPVARLRIKRKRQEDAIAMHKELECEDVLLSKLALAH